MDEEWWKALCWKFENSLFVWRLYNFAMETQISFADLKQERLQKDNG